MADEEGAGARSDPLPGEPALHLGGDLREALTAGLDGERMQSLAHGLTMTDADGGRYSRRVLTAHAAPKRRMLAADQTPRPPPLLASASDALAVEGAMHLSNYQRSNLAPFVMAVVIAAAAAAISRVHGAAQVLVAALPSPGARMFSRPSWSV